MLAVPRRFSIVLISNVAELMATESRGMPIMGVDDGLLDGTQEGLEVGTRTGGELGSLVGAGLVPATNDPLLTQGCNNMQNWSTQVANSLQQSELVAHPHSAFRVA